MFSIVYFAYLLPSRWEPIVLEQLQAMKTSGIYKDARQILMSVISDEQNLNQLKAILQVDFPKIELQNIQTENTFEYSGLKTVYEHALRCDPNETILYCHSKGMISGAHVIIRTHNPKL
jgi:hypothetical protein